MRKKDFDKLVTSVRQAGRIKRGETKPSRVTAFAPADVKAIRRGSFAREEDSDERVLAIADHH
jgi:hypothetical protein